MKKARCAFPPAVPPTLEGKQEPRPRKSFLLGLRSPILPALWLRPASLSSGTINTFQGGAQEAQGTGSRSGAECRRPAPGPLVPAAL